MSFTGHSTTSASKATYDNPSLVAPADRLYAADGGDADSLPDAYDPTAWTGQPGAAARANGYPRKS